MLISALIFGLLGSFHCIGMCGPIAFMLPTDRSNSAKQVFQIMSYHLGRLSTYAFIGVLFGSLGRGFHLFGFQQQVSVITGSIMILTIITPKLFQKVPLSKSISRLVFKVKQHLGVALKRKNNTTFFKIGALNGYLPCGLVYMAILAAVSSSGPLTGSLYMFFFGLGTVPLMTATAYAGNLTSSLFRQTLQRLIPVIIVIIGILFILRGLGLNIPFISPHGSVGILTENMNGCH